MSTPRAWGKGRCFERRSTRPGIPSRWYCAYCVRRDGRSVEVREVAGTREDAERLLARRLRELANARDGVRRFAGPAVERVTVNELLDDVLDDYEVRRLRSRRTAKSHMVRLRAAFGKMRAVDVTAGVVQRYILARRDDGALPATVDREGELLRRAYSLGVRTGRVAYA